MANIIEGIVRVSAPNVANVSNQVVSSVGKMEQSLKKIAPSANGANLALINLGRVVQDAPFGFIGIANNINPLLESFQRLKAETGSTKTALSSLGSSLLGAGGLGLAVSVASSLLVLFGDRLLGSGRAAKEAADNAKQFKDQIKGIFQEEAKEATQVASLIGLLKSETETRERKLDAVKELQRISPQVFNQLKLEGDAVVGLDKAYKAYISNISNVVALKIKQAQLENLITRQLELQGETLVGSQKQAADLLKGINEQRAKDFNRETGRFDAFDQQRIKNARELQLIEKDINGLVSDISQLSGNIKVPTDKLTIEPKDIEINTRPGLGSFKLELPTIFDLPDNNDSRFKTQLKDLETRINQQLAIKIDLSSPGKAFQNLQAGNKDVLGKFAKDKIDQIKSLAGAVNDVLSPAFNSFFSTVAKGGNAFQAFGQAAIQALTSLIAKLASAAILSAILAGISGGGTAIGAGGNKFGDIFKFLGGFGGGTGGIGGGGGFNRAVGFGGMGGRFGGGQVAFRISGRDLVGVLAMGQQSNGRLG